MHPDCQRKPRRIGTVQQTSSDDALQTLNAIAAGRVFDGDDDAALVALPCLPLRLLDWDFGLQKISLVHVVLWWLLH